MTAEAGEHVLNDPWEPSFLTALWINSASSAGDRLRILELPGRLPSRRTRLSPRSATTRSETSTAFGKSFRRNLGQGLRPCGQLPVDAGLCQSLDLRLFHNGTADALI